MSEENVTEDNMAAQAGIPYGATGPGHANMGNASYNYDRRNTAPGGNQGYGYQNYGGPYPQPEYRGNFRNTAPGNYRGNSTPYVMRGNVTNYPNNPNNPGYGRPYYDNYEHQYHHGHHEDYDHHYEHPYYGNFTFNNVPMGMGPNQTMYPHHDYHGNRPFYNRPPGMGWNRMYDPYYQGYPGFDGYGPMPGQGPWGYIRNWFAYNPVTNWVRSPRGSSFLRGLGIATAGLILAPAVVKTIRPLAVQAVHGVMSIVGEVKGVVSDAREELEDIFADAKWENLSDRDEKLQEGE